MYTYCIPIEQSYFIAGESPFTLCTRSALSEGTIPVLSGCDRDIFAERGEGEIVCWNQAVPWHYMYRNQAVPWHYMYRNQAAPWHYMYRNQAVPWHYMYRNQAVPWHYMYRNQAVPWYYMHVHV